MPLAPHDTMLIGYSFGNEAVNHIATGRSAPLPLDMLTAPPEGRMGSLIGVGVGL
jgi:hypothetical protein